MNFLTHKPTATHLDYCSHSCDGWACRFPEWIYVIPDNPHYRLGFYGDCWEFDYSEPMTDTDRGSLLGFLTTTHHHQPASVTASGIHLTYDAYGDLELEHISAGVSYLLTPEEVASFIRLLESPTNPHPH